MEKGQRREIIKGGSNHFCVTAWHYLAPPTETLPHTGGVFVEWQSPSDLCVCVCVFPSLNDREPCHSLYYTCMSVFSNADRMRWHPGKHTIQHFNLQLSAWHEMTVDITKCFHCICNRICFFVFLPAWMRVNLPQPPCRSQLFLPAVGLDIPTTFVEEQTHYKKRVALNWSVHLSFCQLRINRTDYNSDFWF